MILVGQMPEASKPFDEDAPSPWLHMKSGPVSPDLVQALAEIRAGHHPTFAVGRGEGQATRVAELEAECARLANGPRRIAELEAENAQLRAVIQPMVDREGELLSQITALRAELHTIRTRLVKGDASLLRAAGKSPRGI